MKRIYPEEGHYVLDNEELVSDQKWMINMARTAIETNTTFVKTARDHLTKSYYDALRELLDVDVLLTSIVAHVDGEEREQLVVFAFPVVSNGTFFVTRWDKEKKLPYLDIEATDAQALMLKESGKEPVAEPETKPTTEEEKT